MGPQNNHPADIEDFAQPLAVVVTEFQTAVRLSQGDPESVSALGYAYAVSGKANEAANIVDQLKSSPAGEYQPAYYVAIVEAGQGRKDEGVKWLQRAYQTRSAQLPGANTEPMLASLRSEPRLHDLLLHMRLPLP